MNNQSKLFASIILLVLVGCKKDEFVPVDNCPGCTSLIELNNALWPSKPSFAEYEISSSFDTTFEIEVHETDPPFEYATGYLFLIDFPYNIAEYNNDSLTQTDLKDHIDFIVWASDIPYQSYRFESTETNSLQVISIDKSSGAFELSLDLTFHSLGEISPTSPYPQVAHFIGTVKGVITPH